MVQNTEPIPYNSSGGINFSSPYLMGMQRPQIEASLGKESKIKNFIIDSGSSPRNLPMMPSFYADQKLENQNELYDEGDEKDSISDLSSN